MSGKKERLSIVNAALKLIFTLKVINVVIEPHLCVISRGTRNKCEVGVIEVERSEVVGESQELLVSDYLKRGNEISWQLFQNKYWIPKLVDQARHGRKRELGTQCEGITRISPKVGKIRTRFSFDYFQFLVEYSSEYVVQAPPLKLRKKLMHLQ